MAASCATALLPASTTAAAGVPAASATVVASSSREAGSRRLRTWHQPAGCMGGRRGRQAGVKGSSWPAPGLGTLAAGACHQLR